ncbi:hypothetical protein Dsin_003935 [Dipteronia sinensis]|uniref:F-box domain-containing protein n=1 Tax=Dipteronia sinensis TaxID=43782 RepID=A0AAE0BAF2_9ROSI|nr:hypothetical protein Dsin_003935 [Dipteronia sinensis]
MVQGSFDIMMNKRINKVDMISELPEPILYHILSFLPFDEIARTSVLSTTWQRAWRTCPVLKFDLAVFKEYSLHSSTNFNEGEIRRRNELFNCLAKIIRNRHCRDMLSIKEFTLEIILFVDLEFASFVDQCICHAVGCNVKELKILFMADDIYRYIIPPILLFADSIEYLELKCCTLESPVNSVNLSSLGKLVLLEVYIDDCMIKNLLGGCPLIEILHLQDCGGFKSLELFGLTRLEDLCIISCMDLVGVNIETPNLHFLGYTGNIISLSANALALSGIYLLIPLQNVKTQRYIKFLANFYFSEVLTRHISKSVDVMVPRALREKIPSPLSNLKLLNLNCGVAPTGGTIAKVMDSLLWFAPHAKTISVGEFGKFGRFSFKFTYKKQLIYEERTASCCKSLPVSCWHHCMEEVKVEFKEERNFTIFTFNGADIWEKIVTLCESLG